MEWIHGREATSEKMVKRNTIRMEWINGNNNKSIVLLRCNRTVYRRSCEGTIVDIRV
jgi:hypothetical protein